MSGTSNVVFWLESRGLPATDEIVDRIFAAAKASNRMLTHEKMQSIIGADVKIESSAPGTNRAPSRILITSHGETQSSQSFSNH